MKIVWSFLFIFVTLCNAEVKIDRSTRIIGGTEARIGQFPYIVALILGLPNYGQSFCGGSIISSNFILTAAHCLEEAIQINVLAGIHNIFSDTPAYNQAVFPNHIIIHPQYDSENLQNDIGLIFLSRHLPISNNIQTVQLPAQSQSHNQFIGTISNVVGWGRISDDSHDLSATLRFVQLKIIRNEQCAKVYGPFIFSTNICAEGTRNGRPSSSCNGDSGSGVTTHLNGRPTLIGIVSFGTGQCEAGFPPSFTRVTSYLRWISRITGIQIR